MKLDSSKNSQIIYNIDKYREFASEERLNKTHNLLMKRKDDITVVFEDVMDPHNIAACLRTCDATGVLDVHIVYSPKYKKLIKALKEEGLRSSATAKKWVNTYFYTDISLCYSNLRKNGFTILTSMLNTESKSVYDIDFTQNTALVFGNERNGLSDFAFQNSDGNFNVPQVGMIDSLNISVACAVSLYESFRQKNEKGLYQVPTISSQSYEKSMDRIIIEKSKLDIKFIG